MRGGVARRNLFDRIDPFACAPFFFFFFKFETKISSEILFFVELFEDACARFCYVYGV